MFKVCGPELEDVKTRGDQRNCSPVGRTEERLHYSGSAFRSPKRSAQRLAGRRYRRDASASSFSSSSSLHFPAEDPANLFFHLRLVNDNKDE